MKTLRYAMIIGGTLFASATAARAQARTGSLPGRMGGTMSPTTTAASRSVPAGLCQVWIDGLPANRQPAPTDCDTARRQAPANSRIIYGPRSTTGGSVYYPNGQYDPRYDPRSPQYDPRTRQQGGQAYPGERGRGNRDWKAEKEREKAERKWEKESAKADRKQEKEREKEWKKGNKGRDHDDEDDDHRGRGRGGDEDRTIGRGVSSVNAPVVGTLPRTTTTTTTTTRSCVDANRDGVCDIMQTARGRRP
jgi:hypothetical protein